ncbi:2-methylisocitrate lyase-like PEP mutase family enzyme [Kibdelosporangium banguiense]|uniref:2-methylisocitrate lyase-like PEP mutase family enzyme n=1 Tax=Kibdelosporangium banguiense TaxID=1365924 RepID=A0ABS4U278_9PSEU|nr:isocitrate lyase/phosphoenolpyruvate mutase family protein [Kibdelosporangium banguiense]MBP2330305.1 2-methylisocitrate lyase-like PEP mutase family enzyme [Kibdelosporangium banguiense]
MTQRIGTSPGALKAGKALLRSLHVPGRPLILPNAWDAASGLLVEEAGFPVVATSSGAVAESLGYADHQGAPVDEVFAAIRRITRTVSVPVTMDAEGGYGLSAGELADRLAEAGLAGCNIEDTDYAGTGLVDIVVQADRLAALRAADPDLVINARIDLFIAAKDHRAVLDEAIERARAYLAAGADCVYPILVRSADVLESFVGAISPAAVNVAYLPHGPDLPALGALGVARVSLGTGLWWNLQAVLRAKLAKFAAGTPPY